MQLVALLGLLADDGPIQCLKESPKDAAGPEKTSLPLKERHRSPREETYAY